MNPRATLKVEDLETDIVVIGGGGCGLAAAAAAAEKGATSSRFPIRHGWSWTIARGFARIF